MSAIHVQGTVVTVETGNHNLTLGLRTSLNLDIRQNQSQEPNYTRSRAAVKALDSKLYAINMASCPGLQAQGGILAYPHRVRRLPLLFPRFPSPTQTALVTMRVCNTDRRAPPPRFPKPL